MRRLLKPKQIAYPWAYENFTHLRPERTEYRTLGVSYKGLQVINDNDATLMTIVMTC